LMAGLSFLGRKIKTPEVTESAEEAAA
jgi:hypothetical protein